MTFLPYVFSFLLVLAIGSSMAFSSFRSSVQLQAVIVAHHRGVLDLISSQAWASKVEKNGEKKGNKHSTSRESTSESKKQPQHSPIIRNQSVLEGRLNLWLLIQKGKDFQDGLLYEAAVRLIEILYKNCDFYQEWKGRNLAGSIVDQIVAASIHSFDQWSPKDPKLGGIFYAMLQGTSTTYPPLEQYCTISQKKNEKIHFFCASSIVLTAILGEQVAQKLLLYEQEKYDKTSTLLTKKEVFAFLEQESSGKWNEKSLSSIFLFKKRHGTPCCHQDSKIKIRVKRKIGMGL